MKAVVLAEFIGEDVGEEMTIPYPPMKSSITEQIKELNGKLPLIVALYGRTKINADNSAIYTFRGFQIR